MPFADNAPASRRSGPRRRDKAAAAGDPAKRAAASRARSPASPSAETTSAKPAARAASALLRPTASTGSASSSPRRGWPASARAPLALVIRIAAQGGAPRSASATASMRSSGASTTSWPLRAQRRGGALVVGLGAGDQQAHVRRCKEIRAGAALQLAAGVGAEPFGIAHVALARRLERFAAVGLHDHAAKADAVRPTIVAWPAIGVRHEPSSTARNARSAASALSVSA